MKNSLIIAGFILLTSVCDAQEKISPDKWAWLIGSWRGEGDGEPGKGSGKFTFYPDLDKNVFVRRNHSDYPATKDKPQIVHDDLMIVYPDFSGSFSRAIYFDNEAHVINYSVALGDSSIILTSDKIGKTRVFRLTYQHLKSGDIVVKFEISSDGEKFVTYLEGKCIKINE